MEPFSGLLPLPEALFFVSISLSPGCIREMLDWVVDATFEKFRLLAFFAGFGAPVGVTDPISPLLLRSEFDYCGVYAETEPWSDGNCWSLFLLVLAEI
jgi:hypothetical protein